ncbi:unnamed protein product, partial [Sphenostylis stenocarpa]
MADNTRSKYTSEKLDELLLKFTSFQNSMTERLDEVVNRVLALESTSLPVSPCPLKVSPLSENFTHKHLPKLD